MIELNVVFGWKQTMILVEANVFTKTNKQYSLCLVPLLFYTIRIMRIGRFLSGHSLYEQGFETEGSISSVQPWQDMCVQVAANKPNVNH